MPDSRRYRWLLLPAILVLLVGAYWAAGRWLAPGLIADAAQDWARTELGEELALGPITVDPFALTVDIADIAIPAGAPMVRVRRLTIDLDGPSLLGFGQAVRLDRVRIVEPRIDAILGEDGQLNLMRLVPPPSEVPLPALMVSALEVVDGSMLLADRSQPHRPEKRLTPVAFTLRDFHTREDAGGGFRLDGASAAGERFAFNGRLSMAPIASSGTLEVRGLKAASVQAFAGDLFPLVLADGTIDFDLAYAAGYADGTARLDGKLPAISIAGLAIGGTPATLHADGTVETVRLRDATFALSFPAEGPATTSGTLGGISARALSLTGTGPASDEQVQLASLDIDAIGYGGDAPGMRIGDVALNGLTVETRRRPDGSIGLMALLPDAATANGPAPSAESGMPLPAVGTIRLTDARVTLVDRAVTPNARWELAPLTVEASGAGGDGPLQLAARGTINGRAGFTLAGDVQPATPAADLKVTLTGFPVTAILPYSVDFPALQIVSGNIGIDGRLAWRPDRPAFTGSASVTELELIETYQNTDLVAFRTLKLEGIDATPKAVKVRRARLDRPYANLMILEDGTLNFQRLVTMNPTPVVTPAADVAPAPATRAERRAAAKQAEAEKQAAAAEARAALAAPVRQPELPVTVGTLEITGGRLAFADRSLRPAFAADIQGVQGRIGNLSNRPDQVATVALDGYVIDEFSPVTITGALTAMQYDRQTAVDLAFRNIELPVFNPYSGRFAGYAIARGKLTTELSYRIDKRALEAGHRIVIDQLEWGDATDSQEKVSLPLKFATALLKDKNGVIELDVPVTGTLDDPSFRLGPIIWKIVGNAIEKAVTAPFRMLGDLFGGREDVQFVDFAPGSATVPTTAASNLAGIAKGLSEKPGLRLDIPSGPGLPIDATALADRAIAEAAMARDEATGDAAVAGLAALDLAKQHDRLEDLYKARMKRGPDYPDGPDGEEKDARRTREIAWLMDALRPTFQPPAPALASLGKARADAVRLALLQGETPVDAARLFLSGRDMAAEQDGKVRMELKLE